MIEVCIIVEAVAIVYLWEKRQEAEDYAVTLVRYLFERNLTHDFHGWMEEKIWDTEERCKKEK